jgi:3-oxocholest-4-en-26-oyl-CoA dehydrogenase alpha subunit
MYLDLTPEQQALRDELRAYFEDLLASEARGELGSDGSQYRRIVKRMGADGRLGIGWPEEYGGQGRTPTEQLLFFDEAQRAGVPVPLVTLNTVGPTLMLYGTDDQKDFFLPKILRGEIDFAVGYTEPEAGTDLASLRTRAVRDGDEYVINGQKIFTSGAMEAQYVWLAARTDPEAAKHRGISIILVDTSLPGFKAVPLNTLFEAPSDTPTTASFYEDVRVPVSALVGAENEGWRIITTQLNHERLALAAPGRIDRLLQDTIALARDEGLLDIPWVQLNIARVRAKLDALKLFNYRLAWTMQSGALSPADASAVKVYSSEFSLEATRLLQEIVGQAGYLKRGSPSTALAGRYEWLYRYLVVNTFGGGVNEIQRDIIAMAGLGMPRAPR